MNHTTLMLCLFTALASCQPANRGVNQKEKNVTLTEQRDIPFDFNDKVAALPYRVSKKDTIYRDVKGNKYRYFGQIPDSLRTPQQEQLVLALYDVLLNGIIVVNNHEQLKFSQADFLARGLSIAYYRDLKNELRTNNAFFDAHGIKDVARLKSESDSLLRLAMKKL